MKTTGTNPDIEILFEDNHLLAVNKPAGLLSQEDNTGAPDLLTLCKKYLKREYDKKGNVFLGLLHRLDRPVSGVMLFAKTSKAASRLSEQIRNRSIKKSYYAVVEGISPQNGMLQDYLLKNKKTNTVSVVSSKNKEAKKAELIYQREEVENRLSLLNVTLITGRPHQIRVQLAHQGYPIYGDQKYGSKHSAKLSLHASELTFSHPTMKKELSVRTKLPNGFPWDFFNNSNSA
ncbi:RluA family pseudouridine synthase [Rhodohalobacter sulfatireducens]|uniref:RluA family pseudouridine synthase n=1 Tax=Rhodohalobacter sulfatireducens TaxID=2911366 RepID=A0ABS9KBF5_9BACT|nr:RluA family pseudouridine synthase [Rhodohalobacter sulfatireducens]MCG2588166.1 RluA family pseudouridine synthase [Rhodohalobacter sulfatireducens]